MLQLVLLRVYHAYSCKDKGIVSFLYYTVAIWQVAAVD